MAWPTELKARKKAGVDNSSTISDVELRKICREFAEGYIDDQRSQFKRLGGIGEWDNPYITLQKEFEATQIEVFAEMACKGYIYKGLKPVYWCPDCQTALAEAEIEYAEDPCDSIYVKFLVTDDKGLLTQMGADLSKTYFVIWTTTTWTLPANDAICVGPNFTYRPGQVGRRVLRDGGGLVRIRDEGRRKNRISGRRNHSGQGSGIHEDRPSFYRPDLSGDRRRPRYPGKRHRLRPYGSRPRCGRL